MLFIRFGRSVGWRRRRRRGCWGYAWGRSGAGRAATRITGSTVCGTSGCRGRRTGRQGGRDNRRSSGGRWRGSGSRMVPAYSAEARGRSERAFRTYQGRVPKELAADIEAANRYLREVYMPSLNAEFARPAREHGSAFVPYRDLAALDDILCEIRERAVGRDNCVRFERLALQLPADRRRPHYVKARERFATMRTARRRSGTAAQAGPDTAPAANVWPTDCRSPRRQGRRGVVHPLPTATFQYRGPAPWTKRGQPRQTCCHDPGGDRRRGFPTRGRRQRLACAALQQNQQEPVQGIDAVSRSPYHCNDRRGDSYPRMGIWAVRPARMPSCLFLPL